MTNQTTFPFGKLSSGWLLLGVLLIVVWVRIKYDVYRFKQWVKG